MSCTPQELADLLNPIIYREIASIGAIDTAMRHEDNPGYVVLFRSAKSGKQANIEQMTAMLRVEGMTPVTSAAAIESLLKLQAAVMEWLGTTPMLRAMRIVEAEIAAHYDAAYGRLDGMYQKSIEKAWHRCKRNVGVLTAHIGKRARMHIDALLRVPDPLENYFAHDEARVCMRCLFDRPGELGPLERHDPHPYQYICAACHEEVLSSFPPDIAEKSDQWSDRDLESRIIEKALSRPSKLIAEGVVVAKMSGLVPDMPLPAMAWKKPVDVTGAPTATQPPPETDIPPARSPEERLYDELLFDYESVRNNW
ncbi:MAG TPA: hypothetical protein VF980_18060 [Thermoanaerobaculia bacterium]